MAFSLVAGEVAVIREGETVENEMQRLGKRSSRHDLSVQIVSIAR